MEEAEAALAANVGGDGPSARHLGRGPGARGEPSGRTGPGATDRAGSLGERRGEGRVGVVLVADDDRVDGSGVTLLARFRRVLPPNDDAAGRLVLALGVGRRVEALALHGRSVRPRGLSRAGTSQFGVPETACYVVLHHADGLHERFPSLVHSISRPGMPANWQVGL